MSNIKISLGKRDVIFIIHMIDSKQEITLDMIKRIWHENIEEIDVEYLYAEPFGSFVFGCITASKGQDGVVFVWDTNTQQFIHYSNGEFAVKVSINNNNVYILREVSYWGIKAHLQLDFCPLNTMDRNNNTTKVELSEETEYQLANNPDDYVIVFDGERPTVKVSNE